jgi:diacylglycerol kinase family enzyme
MVVLRLPMGTGHDGADAPKLGEALDLLIKPTRIVFTPALRLHTAAAGPARLKCPYLAFNILSVGFDAFITHMTNKMKKKLPGDFYKLWVDIAALLYGCFFKVGFIDIKAVDSQGLQIQSFNEKVLLLAVGISGHRTYGSQKKVLPDDRNVCVVKQMPLLRKLVFKTLFIKGTHIDKPEAMLFTARRIEFSGIHTMLAQMDGETVLLQQGDFPAVIEFSDPVIPVLKLIT